MSIRGGFGMYYDHFGEGIMNSFDAHGSFGLSTQAENGVDQHVDTAPRFIDAQTVPTSIIPLPSSSGSFRYPGGVQAISYGWIIGCIRLRLRLTWPFPRAAERLIVEAAYTGRLAHRSCSSLIWPCRWTLWTQRGGDYFAAATKMTKLADAGTPSPTFRHSLLEHMFPGAIGGGLSHAKYLSGGICPLSS